MDIRYSVTALRALRKCDKRDLIRRKIEDLAAKPDAIGNNVKRLTGRPESRLRVQDWRVIFRIEDDILWVDVIAPRGSAYEVSR